MGRVWGTKGICSGGGREGLAVRAGAPGPIPIRGMGPTGPGGHLQDPLGRSDKVRGLAMGLNLSDHNIVFQWREEGGGGGKGEGLSVMFSYVYYCEGMFSYVCLLCEYRKWSTLKKNLYKR